MVRNASERRRKYETSMDAQAIAHAFEAVKSVAVEQESTYFSQIADVEAKAKGILEEAGVTPFLIAQYLVVARKCYSLAKRFSGVTLREEADRVLSHWESRGLLRDLLSKVCNISGCGCASAGSSGYVLSQAPPGGFKVTNIYVVLENGLPKLKVVYEE